MTDERIKLMKVGAAGVLAHAKAAEIVERDAWLDFFDAAPLEVRDEFSLSSVRIGGMGLLGSPVLSITEFNRAMAVGIGRPAAAQELGAAIEWLDQHAASNWALQIAPAANSGPTKHVIDLERLAPAGAGWVKFAQMLPTSSSWSPTTNARPVAVSADTAVVFGNTVQGGFGLPESSAHWFAALVGRPGWHCFLSTLNGEPAGAAAMYVTGEAAWCGMSTTLSQYRRQGVQSSLIAARLRAAADRRITVLTSETGRPSSADQPGYSSYRNLRRGGFLELYARPNVTRLS